MNFSELWTPACAGVTVRGPFYKSNMLANPALNQGQALQFFSRLQSAAMLPTVPALSLRVNMSVDQVPANESGIA
jgi:hypothetical protein